MLSDEEKKAYDNLIMLKYFTMEKEDKQAIGTILNLIEKQSKEIEKLYEDNLTLAQEIEELKKDKLELINKNHVVHIKDVEKELIEMRNDLDIKNAEINMLNNMIDINYISKVKIKAKIEELDNQKRQWIEDRDNKHKDSEIIYAIEVLQSLLEKE